MISLDSASAPQEAAARDAALVERFKSGDESAFHEIVLLYRQKMFAVALVLLRNRADAEEIAQDTFVRAYRGLANFRGDSSLATWLHRITMNLARNRYWYFFRRRRHATLSLDCPLSDEGDATFADVIASNGDAPAHHAALEEFAAVVDDCMERVPRKHREILVLRNHRHLSYDRIAAILCIEVGTVKSRLARARNSLRREISLTCPDLKDDAEIFRLLQEDPGSRSAAVRQAQP